MALLYIITAAGVGVNLHYCNDRIADVKINSPAGSCIDETSGDCAKPMAMVKGKMNCRYSHLNIKVKDDHQKGAAFIVAGQFPLELFTVSIFDFLTLNHRVRSEYHDYRGPPDISLTDIPVFLKNCTFRI